MTVNTAGWNPLTVSPVWNSVDSDFFYLLALVTRTSTLRTDFCFHLGANGFKTIMLILWSPGSALFRLLNKRFC